MHRSSDWNNPNNNNGGGEVGGGEWSSMREVPYQQQKYFQPNTHHRLQYGQHENEILYRRWRAAQERSYAAATARPIYAADGSVYYRRYSLDAPPLPPQSRSAFIGQPPLDMDDDETPSTSTAMLYPQAIGFGDMSPLPPPGNIHSRPFYFNQNSTAAGDANIINTEQVVHNLTLFGRFLEVMQSWPLPHVSFTTACILVLLATFISPRLWAENVIFPAFRLSFGTLYPAYASYKAVRTKNVKEYVKWMMYWIVYAFFTCIETFTDIFLAWFPFYYEVKVIIVLWLLSPATKGSSTLYRKFVHPMLTRREQEIDEYLNQAKERGYSAVLQLGTKGVNYATNVIMQTALKGGGNLVQTIRRSYSLSDLSEPDVHRTQDEIDDVVHMRSHQRMLRPRPQAGGIARSASGTRHSTGMYFSEVDVVKGADAFNYNIRSSEDISSGYSSAEPVSAGLSRTSSMTNASKARLKGRRTEIIKEPKQFRTTEPNFLPRSPLPTSGLSHLEYEADYADCELLENPKVFDAQKCIKILEEMPNAPSQDDDDRELVEVQQRMHRVEENNDVPSSIEMTNIEAFGNIEKGIKDDESLSPQSKTLAQMQKLNDTVKESLASSATVAINNEVALMDEINFRDNTSICSSVDTFNTLEGSDEDNESDKFSDALPSLADDEEELNEEEITEVDNQKKTNANDIAITNDPRESVDSIVSTSGTPITQIPFTSGGMEKTEKALVNAKELQDTLKEIKDSFRANIVTTPTTTMTSSKLITTSDRKTYTPRPSTHNKGKAPAPPLPPRPTRPIPAANTATITDTSTASSHTALDTVGASLSRSPSPAPSNKGIFKNFKTNIFRFGGNANASDKQSDVVLEKSNQPTPPFETQL